MKVWYGAVEAGSSRAGFVGRVLLGLLALSLAVVGVVGLPTASAAASHTYGNNALCAATEPSVAYEDPGKTRLVIDLDKLDEEITEVIVGSNSASSCAVQLVSVEFRQTESRVKALTVNEGAFRQGLLSGDDSAPLESVVFPAGLQTLTIEDRAFAQEAIGAGDTLLSSIKFPDGLQTLTIGAKAFVQEVDGGVAALAEVKFPAGLQTLTIGSGAFQRYATSGSVVRLESVEFPAGLQTLTIEADGFGMSVYDGGDAPLKSVEFPAGLQTLRIDRTAFAQVVHGGGSALLKSVEFPAGLQTVEIGRYAFAQLVLGGGSASLESVVFPAGLPELKIGEGAFEQDVRDGGDALLSSVVFLDGLQELTIGSGAFAQTISGNGDALLSSVVFPNSLQELTIGDIAFAQVALGGGSTSLESVVFPAGLQKLRIGTQAFYQGVSGTGTVALRQFMFSTDQPLTVTAPLGADITLLEVGDESGVLPWLWSGADSDTATAWGADGESYQLVGNAQVVFNPNGGELPGANAGESVTKRVPPIWSGYDNLDFTTWSFGPMTLPGPVDAMGDGFDWGFSGWSVMGVPGDDLLSAGTGFVPTPGRSVLVAHWNASSSDSVSAENGSAVFNDPRIGSGASVVSREVSVPPSQGSATVVGSEVVFDATGLDEGDYSFDVVYVFDDERVVTISHTVVVSAPANDNETGGDDIPAVPTGGSLATGMGAVPAILLLFALAGGCLAVRTRRLW
jgi:hypothetical protein